MSPSSSLTLTLVSLSQSSSSSQARSIFWAFRPSVYFPAVGQVARQGLPTHFETYDPKPSAPVQYRGPLGVAATNLPGVYLSELMTEQAKIMDKLAIIRSITHSSSSHGTSAHLTQTGYYLRDPQNRTNDMPACGAITSKLRGANSPGLPAYVSMPTTMRFGNAAYFRKSL